MSPSTIEADAVRKQVSEVLRSDEKIRELISIKKLKDKYGLDTGISKRMKKFVESRKLMLCPKKGQGKIASRIVDDNFPRFCHNIAIINGLEKTMHESDELALKLISPNDYCRCLSNSCILSYNQSVERVNKILAIYGLSLKRLLGQIGYKDRENKKMHEDRNGYSCDFGSASFGAGWDANSENRSLISLYRKENEYYLGILGNRIIKNNKYIDNNSEEPFYEKMVYRAFDFGRQFSRIVFCKYVKDEFAKGAERVELSGERFSDPLIICRADFEEAFHIENERVSPKTGRELKYTDAYLKTAGDRQDFKKSLYSRIRLAKKFLSVYRNLKIFDFCGLKDTEEYKSWHEFTKDVNSRTYSLGWKRVGLNNVNDMVKTGDLYLFKLDFIDGRYVNGSMHRLDEQAQLFYAVFAKDNQVERALRLLGGVEVWYRPVIEKRIIAYKKGEILLNKRDTNNKPLSPRIHCELYKFLNGYISDISHEARILLDNNLIKWKITKHDIVRDKRYTEEQFVLRVPIAINHEFDYNAEVFEKHAEEVLSNNALANKLIVKFGKDFLAKVLIVNSARAVIYEKYYNQFNEYDFYVGLKQLALNNGMDISWKYKNLMQTYLKNLVGELRKLIVRYEAPVYIESQDAYYTNRMNRFISYKDYSYFIKQLIKRLRYVPKADSHMINGYQLVPDYNRYSQKLRSFGILSFCDVDLYINNT